MKYVKPHILYDGLREMNSKLTSTERLSGKSYLLLGLNIRRDFVGLALTDYLISQVYPIMPCKNHMDSVTRYFPGLISQHNLYGFIVGKPRQAEKPSRCEDIDKDGAKFISDLCIIEKFNGLKYTYWSDLYASEHKEYYYKRYVEHYPGYDDLPLNKKQLLVQKYHAVATLEYVKPHTLYDGLREMNSKLTRIERLSGKSYLLLGLNIRRDFVGLALTDYLISQVYPIMPCKKSYGFSDKIFSRISKSPNIIFMASLLANLDEQKSHLIDKDVAKFISDLCSIEKFNGLKYTYWCDLYASEHKEYYYKRYVENYPAYEGLPLYKKELLVQKCFAVATLEALQKSYGFSDKIFSRIGKSPKSQHNLYGFIVGKPRRAEKPSHCEDIDKDAAKFISDLCSIEKFNGLKYTYWSDLCASEDLIAIPLS
ncbi:hypothetical protein EZV62_023579 [Acer yangbiense]|uniref:Uncharacterized protein n=1 Tax=Acer yangbiense TaxID=1000413 RepID=A0A5C7H2T8_9ROSI|nr:hypothetical protein EZV62_023579 [Acer yangbiense]